MTKSEIYAAVSRIERAPNVSRVINAYDAAVGGSNVSVHRLRGTEWQVWYGEACGFCGDFGGVRRHLAEYAEELLEHEAEKAEARKPAMVPQPAQQQQARDLRVEEVSKVEAIRSQGVNLIDAVRVRRIEAEAARRAWMACLNHGLASHEAQARYSEATRQVESSLKALWDKGENLRLAEMEERRAAAPAMVAQPAQQQQACAGGPRPDPVVEPAPIRHDYVAAMLDELVQEDADEAEIAAIGPLGGQKYIAPGTDGLDVFDDSKPFMTIPRGLTPETARLLIAYWDLGYRRGLKNGAAEIQRGMRRLLGASVL